MCQFDDAVALPFRAVVQHGKDSLCRHVTEIGWTALAGVRFLHVVQHGQDLFDELRREVKECAMKFKEYVMKLKEWVIKFIE